MRDGTIYYDTGACMNGPHLGDINKVTISMTDTFYYDETETTGAQVEDRDGSFVKQFSDATYTTYRRSTDADGISYATDVNGDRVYRQGTDSDITVNGSGSGAGRIKSTTRTTVDFNGQEVIADISG